MYSDLPAQFIEGINENEEPTTSLQVGDYPYAIRYKPTVRYQLDRIEIYGDRQLREEREHTFNIYTDYKKLPSNNCLSSGRLVIPAEEKKSDWFSINIEPKIVVFPDRIYWIATLDHPLAFYIGRAREGVDVPAVANVTSAVWQDADICHKFMLKFYGRVV